MVIKRSLSIIVMIMCILATSISCGDDSSDTGVLPEVEVVSCDYASDWNAVNGMIAYLHSQDYSQEGTDSSGVYVIKSDGTENRLFYRNNISLMNIAWAPDGSKLLLCTGSGVIILSYPDGIENVLETPDIEQCYSAGWSPEGNIIFSAQHSGPDRGIYFMNQQGEYYRRKIAYGRLPNMPYPDSVLYQNYDTMLTSGAFCMVDTSGIFHREIYVTENPTSVQRLGIDTNTGKIIFDKKIPDVYAMGVYKYSPGSSNEKLFFSNAYHPSFSPDGTQILFTKIDGQYGRLWIVNWDGSDLRQLTF